ncbi:hypothetical protein [Ekhidna lutea]|uniref:hypothetical protein n=1 Tax=Ekhidna lutea TaxID=447679 RepID=UPI000B78AECF|nr:hypothetical protein [Ekhidna lutea]
MNPKLIRPLAFAGIILALFLSVWYLMKTYKEGNPRWIFLIMAFGIAVLLSQNLRGGGRRKD